MFKCIGFGVFMGPYQVFRCEYYDVLDGVLE